MDRSSLVDKQPASQPVGIRVIVKARVLGGGLPSTDLVYETSTLTYSEALMGAHQAWLPAGVNLLTTLTELARGESLMHYFKDNNFVRVMVYNPDSGCWAYTTNKSIRKLIQ